MIVNLLILLKFYKIIFFSLIKYILYFKINSKITFNNKKIKKNIIIKLFLYRNLENINFYKFQNLFFLRSNLKNKNNLKFSLNKNKNLFYNNKNTNNFYKINELYSFNNFYKANFNFNIKTKLILNFYNNFCLNFFYKNFILSKFDNFLFFYFFTIIRNKFFLNFSSKNKNTYLSNKNFNFFFRKLNTFIKFKINNLKNRFYFYFLNTCFEYLFKSKFFIKISNEDFLNLKKKNINSFFKDTYKLKKYFFRNFKNLNFNYFIKILMISLIKKDLNFLSKWLSINIELLNLKIHKKFLTFLKNLFLENEEKIITHLNINGFFLDIRGKVGVAGNSKKRHFYFYVGNLKYSSKNSKMDLTQDVIKTYTGCLGLTMILSY